MEINSLVDGVNTVMGLGLYLQIAIPAGYLGYLISRCGISDNDKTINIIFLSAAFGLISLVTWHASSPLSSTAQIFFSILTPLVTALLWRRWVYKWVMAFLYKFRFCNASQFPSIWLEITQNTKVGMSQATVYLKNGSALSCEFFYDFADAPIELFRTDRFGNVALYLTHEKKPGEERFQPATDVAKEDVAGTFYYRLTYIPKEEIERVEFVTNHPTF